MDDYTPSTEEVERACGRYLGPEPFRRWLAEHDREVEARGLESLIEQVTEAGLVQMFGGEKFVSVALLVSEARAEQVREGN